MIISDDEEEMSVAPADAASSVKNTEKATNSQERSPEKAANPQARSPEKVTIPQARSPEAMTSSAGILDKAAATSFTKSTEKGAASASSPEKVCVLYDSIT